MTDASHKGQGSQNMDNSKYDIQNQGGRNSSQKDTGNMGQKGGQTGQMGGNANQPTSEDQPLGGGSMQNPQTNEDESTGGNL